MTNKKEKFKVSGEDIIKKIKEIIKEGNARRIIIKNEDGKSVAEFPLTVGAVGALINRRCCGSSYCPDIGRCRRYSYFTYQMYYCS
jgi:hypothetical protein